MCNWDASFSVKVKYCQSAHAGKALYKEGCTVVFKREGSDKVVIGPYVC